ncbi:tail fiber assembly protein [Citrobacter koseri]|uniref:tail fiber assembly protein n=1 Tax=Citrobacter koseri TaxID=545 RepID=UPI0018FFA7FC|nr:tail fiber assembly protein [Citrobacter koseri]EMD6813377.1 tail fiber assembly protein [Citrobacter koseri]MBJ8762921.1 tail fiber assembly protein [Citrobacter koseri]MBJ9101970.1 tail fiber assembly protein [Citrobacter koseri]HBD3030991.1 tail fiber assembly protein [Citrobacter koseri]HBD3038839.1 tail fiber assembly protein [Citrobacter koseri]
MTFKMSKEAQTIKIYNLRADTSEFIGGGDAYIPAHTGLPAYCTDIEPPEAPAGHVAVFDDNEQKWDVVEDHRGKTVYDIQTGQAISIESLGSLPDNVVSVAPDGSYEKWDGKKWVKDEEAENAAKIREAEATKNSLMQTANEKITLLQDAVDLDMATDEEKELLLKWKKYRVLLSRVDTSKPEWPEQSS